MADLDVDEWVHLVEETALVVFEVSGLEVEMDVGKRTVSREGFPTLAAAVGDMERGVGL